MRAAVFIRYHSGDGFGHIGWAFESSPARVDAGSVENHHGHLFTPASKMGFWNGEFGDPVGQMRKRGYDDLKWIEVENPNPRLAYATVLWIRHKAYKVLHRNCEDDAYDVLRAYGVENLPSPSLLWLPKSWFKRFDAALAHLSDFDWPNAHADDAKNAENGELDGVEPWTPTWRRPWHRHYHALNAHRLGQLFGARKAPQAPA